MTKEVIEQTILASPGPFTLILDTGDRVAIGHPDALQFLCPGPKAKTPELGLAVHYKPNGGWAFIDLDRVRGVEMPPKNSVENIIKQAEAKLFRPFTIRTTDGRDYLVTDRTHVRWNWKKNLVVYFDENGFVITIDVANIIADDTSLI